MGVQQLLGLAWADGLSCTLPSVVGDASAVEEGTFQEASRDADVLDLSGVVRTTSRSCTSPGIAAMKSCVSLELHGTGTILSPNESHIGRLVNEF